ncbi:MAG: class I SAM-dependent methyltransferase [Mesorhizobium sp.]|nr:MAG: class I SAM-dependent methyltransferase [Mesorhizobium sp.]
MPTLYDLPSLYDAVVTPGPCEPFYRRLACSTGGPILELACGTGRLTIPLALDGHEVVGLDASYPMIRAARAKADKSRAIQILKWRFEELGRKIPPVALMRLRAFFPQEMPLRLALVGLELAARYGDFSGGHFTGCSPNQIYVARAARTSRISSLNAHAST